MPLDRAQHDHAKTIGGARKRKAQRRSVMAGDDFEVHVEALQLVPEWRHRSDRLGRAESLQTVVIDENSQIRKPVVRSKDQGFPGRAFLPLAVRSQAHDVRIGSAKPQGQRCSRRQR
jgi:hypothetical protein